MKKIDLMIFDFDGTLVATGTDLIISINHMLNSLQLNEKSEQEILSFVGDGVHKLIERALGPDHQEFQEKAMNLFTDYYSNHLLDNVKLYPHIEEVLIKYESKPKVILTNKRHVFALVIAQQLNIAKYFVEIIGADSTPFQKPDRRVIDFILNKYGAAKEKVVMIGDGINDVIVAKQSGILSCACLNGIGNRQDLLNLKADYYCEDILEINLLFE